MPAKKSKIPKLQISLVSSACIFAAIPTAQAQSSVTLYGIVDASMLYTSRTPGANGANAGHQYAFQSSGQLPSLFGLRGTEDLGGGLKTTFTLESGISIANGQLYNSNGNFFGRQAFVGLSGNFGTVTAGLQISPFLYSIYFTDSRTLKHFGSAIVVYSSNVAATGIFTPNSVEYLSPEIAGLQGAAMYSFGGTPGSFHEGQQYSAALMYHLKGFRISAAMYSSNAGGSAATIPVPSAIAFEGRNIGAGYTFDNITIKAAYTIYKVAGSFDSRVLSGGFSYNPIPYLLLDGGAYYSRDGNNSNNHSILGSLGINYLLSKQTSLYTQVGYVNNHGAMNTSLTLNSTLSGLPGSQVGVSIGITHNF